MQLHFDPWIVSMNRYSILLCFPSTESGASLQYRHGVAATLYGNVSVNVSNCPWKLSDKAFARHMPVCIRIALYLYCFKSSSPSRLFIVRFYDTLGTNGKMQVICSF